jgi:hypothetical protein
MDDKKPQSEKFKDAAKEAGCDPDEARWAERLRKVAKVKPTADQPD